ncbi:expressed unknown protein [Seminavis robusta]|uniref:Uncharacterized protein n=1 Tax=Seminavis robusta TaxID=568900 RepID=A0A9N8HQA5_9STRA|nr:expressed unknown protein [Seminavis robusta]|eukprot:Sro966_g225780.1 n/a (190) ;mRNA; r:37847-38416
MTNNNNNNGCKPNHKAMVLGIVIGACYHVFCFGAVLAADQMESSTTKVGAEFLVAAIAVPCTVMVCIYIMSKLSSSSGSSSQQQQANDNTNSSSLALDWAVLIGFVIANIVLGTLGCIYFTGFSNVFSYREIINIAINVAILIFCCCWPKAEEKSDNDAAEELRQPLLTDDQKKDTSDPVLVGQSLPVL